VINKEWKFEVSKAGLSGISLIPMILWKIQPMTQYLEEKSGLKQIADEHERRVIPLKYGWAPDRPDLIGQ
jgi:hypothetical protein